MAMSKAYSRLKLMFWMETGSIASQGNCYSLNDVVTDRIKYILVDLNLSQ